MTPNEYQTLALRTEQTPAFAHHNHELSQLLHAAIGACTEVGELQDAIKKHLMYGKTLDRVNIIEEVGDVLWYLALALTSVDATMEDAMERNIAKLRKRYADKFTEEQALVRDLDAEREVLARK